MSQMHSAPALEWDLVDRLRKSMRVSGHTATSLGAVLDVHRNTVNNYVSGRIAPDRRTLISWAFATGVPVEWLESGQAGEGPNPDGGAPRSTNR